MGKDQVDLEEAKSEVKWGDADVDADMDDTVDDMEADSKAPLDGSARSRSPVVPTPSVSTFITGPDKDGIKTITEFRTNRDGSKVKVVRKVKVNKKQARVNRNVVARRKWAKFGDCEGMGPGPEQNITYHSIEQINLKLRPRKREDEKQNDDVLDKLKTQDSIVVCRNCGETGHWTLKCPKRNAIDPSTGVRISESLASLNYSEPRETRAEPAPSSTGGKYIPLSKRAGAATAGRTGGGREGLRDDGFTVRVTNLSEDTTEDDLRDLFRPFGHTTRIYLARDRQTGVSRGFAFISYTDRDSAQKAIDKLNGHGYDNLILYVEFAKPREEGEQPPRRE